MTLWVVKDERTGNIIAVVWAEAARLARAKVRRVFHHAYPGGLILEYASNRTQRAA